MTNRYLSIYLKDHLAMAKGGVDFMRRVAESNSNNPLGDELHQMSEELEEERDTLSDLLDRLEVDPSQLKMAGAWLAEKAGRFKFNGEFTRYSPLSRVLELEFLMAAVQARKGLWKLILDARKLYPVLADVPARRLEVQADGQLLRLETMHQRAVRQMLKTGQQQEQEERHSDRP